MLKSKHQETSTTAVDYQQVLDLMQEIKDLLHSAYTKGLQDIWIPKKSVMKFFDYGASQMHQMEKDHNLVSSKIKARKFYSAESILNLIEKNKTKNYDTI
jgi:hypothetical protein